MKRIILAFLLIIVVGVGAAAYYKSRAGVLPAVSTSVISEGPIVDAVSATGSVQAVTTVQVGTQVSGTVSWLGADFNSLVRKGQVIARLETSLLDAERAQSAASLSRATADVDNAKVQLADAQQKNARSQETRSGSSEGKEPPDRGGTIARAVDIRSRSCGRIKEPRT